MFEKNRLNIDEVSKKFSNFEILQRNVCRMALTLFNSQEYWHGIVICNWSYWFYICTIRRMACK
jgi:hypothetical protein